VGKPLGIFAFAWLAVRTGLGSLPVGVTWGQIFGTGCLAGIGFTMSLFITDLAFDTEILISSAKLGILAASLAAAAFGAVVLVRSLPARTDVEPAVEGR
jgi:NhaA family Na+:H+ antiporter